MQSTRNSSRFSSVFLIVGVAMAVVVPAVRSQDQRGPTNVPPILAPAPHDILKNRYISIDPRGAGAVNPSAHHIRIILVSSQVGSVTGIGSTWWANAPDADCISILDEKPVSEPDWSACPVVHLTGCPIIPTSTYAMAIESAGKLSANAFFETQAKPGIKWHGDCVGAFSGTEWTGPNGQVNIDDAVAAIKTFQNPSLLPGCGTPPCNATHTSVTDVAPNLVPAGPNKIVNFEDVLIVILGFRGQEYPGADLTQCLGGDPPDPCVPIECNDPFFCNGEETCQGDVCVSGADPCPGQECDEIANQCVTCACDGNLDCDDGQFCNGSETCNACTCFDGSDPCPGQGCDENNNACGSGAVFAWIPIDSTGPSTIVDNEITLPSGGQTVTLDIRLSGWGAAIGAPALTAYQAIVDSNGYTTGTGDPLNPLGWPGSPTDGAYIATNACMINGRPCVSPEPDCDLGTEGFCVHNSDWVFDAGNAALPAVATGSLDYAWGAAATVGSRVDGGIGITYHGGILKVDVPPGAAGTYTIGFVTGESNSFMNDEGLMRIQPLELVPALITVGDGPPPVAACCLGDGSCVDVTESACSSMGGMFQGAGTLCADDPCPVVIPCCVGGSCSEETPQDCASAGGSQVCACLGDGDLNLIDDACECNGITPDKPSVEDTGIGSCDIDDDCDDILGFDPVPCIDQVCYARKNRSVSFQPNYAGNCVAFRVDLTFSVPFPGCTFSGRWVGEADPITGIAMVQDTPFYSASWPAVVHVGGEAVVPSSVYEIFAVEEGCDTGNPSNFSDPLSLPTSTWGDVVGFFDVEEGAWTPSDNNINFDDISQVIKGVKLDDDAVPAEWLNIGPEDLDRGVDCDDVGRVLLAFQGFGYSGDSPCARATSSDRVSGDGSFPSGTMSDTRTNDLSVERGTHCQQAGPCLYTVPSFIEVVPNQQNVEFDVFVENLDPADRLSWFQTVVSEIEPLLDANDPPTQSLNILCVPEEEDVRIDINHGNPDFDYVFRGESERRFTACRNILATSELDPVTPGIFISDTKYLATYSINVSPDAVPEEITIEFIDWRLSTTGIGTKLQKDLGGGSTAPIDFNTASLTIQISSDCDGNFRPDRRDLECGFGFTCDDSGDIIPCNAMPMPPDCKAGSDDCDLNAILDVCDITEGRRFDYNDSGIPDVCEFACFRDDPLPDSPGSESFSPRMGLEIVNVGGGIQTFNLVDIGSNNVTLAIGSAHWHGETGDDLGEPEGAPSGFPETKDGGQESHLEITSMELDDIGENATVRHQSAGTFDKASIGEVQGRCADFPGDGFLNLFLGLETPARTIYNLTPLVMRGELADFDFSVWESRENFCMDMTVPPIPLVDSTGVQRAYLTNAMFGDPIVPDLPVECQLSSVLNGPVSFTVDSPSTGLPIDGSDNDVRLEWESSGKTVRVYHSSNAAPAGAAPDHTNARDALIAGFVPGGFLAGDAINSLSFGRDGTIGPPGVETSSFVLFSVTAASNGRLDSDVSREAARNQSAADIFMSAIGAFGSYAGNEPIPSSCTKPTGNCLVADQTLLGLGPFTDVVCVDPPPDCGANDNITALELGLFDAASLAFLTLDHSSLVGDENIVFVYNPGPPFLEFTRASLGDYATSVDLGLQNGDKIDALAVSDINGETLIPDGVWNAGDEVLFSLAIGSPTLTSLGASGADLFRVRHGGLLARLDFADDFALLSTDELDALDVGAGRVFKDFNANGIDDRCDEARGFSLDGDGNGFPDEVELKNRYVSFAPSSVDSDADMNPLALRIDLTGSVDFIDLVGQTQGWVGPPLRVDGELHARVHADPYFPKACNADPTRLCDVDSDCWKCDSGPSVGEHCLLDCPNPLPQPDPPPAAACDMSDTCGPGPADWSVAPFIHVTGCQIVPVATYDVRSSVDGINVGTPFEVRTIPLPIPKRWGDVVSTFDGVSWGPPQKVVNIDDALAIIKKFQEAPGAPRTSRADVEPQEPNRIVNINDVFQIILAFSGGPYPYGCPLNPCPVAEESIAEGNCADGIDNDCDGNIDAADPDC